MPQKLNKAGKMQDYIPKGNGDASGEYGTSNGTNKNFTASDKKSSKANVITENKSVAVENKGKKLTPREKIKKAIETEDIDESNKLMDEATSELKFNNDKERDEFLDIVATYSDPQEMFDYLDKVENKGIDDDEEAYEGHTISKAFGDGYIVYDDNKEYEPIFETKEEAKKWIDGKNEISGKAKSNKANIIDDDLTGVKKNDNLTPTNALKIENMNEAQLDNKIEKTQREIDRLEKIMSNNKMSDNLSKDFPLGVGGSGWSAERKKQFSQSVERDTIKAKNYTDAYNEKESLNNRLNALNKAKDQIKGTGKTQEQLKQDAISNTQSTLNWEKGKIQSPYGKGTINVIKANGYEIRSVDNGFYSIYKDGKSVGNTNKLKDAKAYVERIVQKQSKANVIS